MSRYFVRRFLLLIPLLCGITVISFLVMHLAPGTPTDMATDLNVKASLQAKMQLIKLYGLDKPLHEQYLLWLSRIIHGDFGRSFRDGRTVVEKIAERVPITLMINSMALLIALGIGIPLGIRSASRAGSLFDRVTGFFLFVGFALPVFWAALLAIDFFGVQLRILPVSGLSSLGAESWPWSRKGIDCARHLILPVFLLALGDLAVFSRYIRSSLVDILKQDYIRTARAKGLSEKVVLYRHALRNALLPLITVMGLSIPGLLAGSVLIESIFAIPGMGRLYFDSVMSRDYPVIMGILFAGAFLTLLGNFVADIVYAFADPRIHYGEHP